LLLCSCCVLFEGQAVGGSSRIVRSWDGVSRTKFFGRLAGILVRCRLIRTKYRTKTRCLFVFELAICREESHSACSHLRATVVGTAPFLQHSFKRSFAKLSFAKLSLAKLVILNFCFPFSKNIKYVHHAQG
jgi:hypothetical protein